MLNLDEARGLAAAIWTKPNFRRRVMDVQLAEEIANLLVDEVAKHTFDNKEFEHLKQGHEKLKIHYNEALSTIDKLKLDYTNLQSENESLKLGKKDEVV